YSLSSLSLHVPLLLVFSHFLMLLWHFVAPPRFTYTTLFRSLPSLHDIPSVAYQNSYHYFSELLNQSNRLWLLLLLLLLVLFFIRDRKSTRLNSSHVSISYAVFCLKK